MESENINSKVILFFENIEKYYGCKTDITEGLTSKDTNFDTDLTTWNLSEFTLLRSAYRNNGNKFMLEGNGLYYEISASDIVNFNEPGRNKFEFIEQYGDSVFRITKIRFHYKY
ncbi:hypothetical protein [Flavobacterium sp.]|uniref:hypothetical protein n=1 Tax=Flavobacterium sp. TaxID=239 RepID=UPI00286CD689|nr:hypothetical protein [Flavobacterium sp.]